MKKGFILLSIFLVLLMGLVSAQCPLTISAQNTADFFVDIQTLDQDLDACPQAIEPPMSQFVKNEELQLIIQMQDETTQSAILSIENSVLQGISLEGTGTGYTVEITECGFDTGLMNNNDIGVYAYLYQQDEVSFSAEGFFNKISLGVAKAFIGPATNSLQTPVAIDCAQTAV